MFSSVVGRGGEAKYRRYGSDFYRGRVGDRRNYFLVYEVLGDDRNMFFLEVVLAI